MKTLSRILVCLFLILSFFSCKKKENVLFNKINIDNLSENKKEHYLDSILDLLKTKKNDSVVRNLYLSISNGYYNLNKLEKSLPPSLKALELSTQANDSTRMAKALYFIGDSYRSSKKDSAYYYYLQAEKIYYKLTDDDNTARMLFSKAYVLFFDGNYIECEVETSKALKFLKNSKDLSLIYTCNALLGNCLEKLANYDKALGYHQIALDKLEMMKLSNIDKNVINKYYVASTINICNLYDLKGEYSKSIQKLQSILTKDLEENSPIVYAATLSNLAYSKMKNGQYDNVYPMLLKAEKIAEKSGDESDVLYKKINIGKYFLTQKDTLKAIEILKEANKLAIKIKNGTEILTSSKLLSDIDKKNRTYYTNKYINLSDSINTVQKNAHNKYARIEYETSRIEDENKVLTKKNLYLLIGSFVVLLLLLSVLIFRYLKFKDKELQFLIKEKKTNEEIYLLLIEQAEKINIARENEKTKIAKELHDGVMNKIYGIRMNLGFYNSKIDTETIEKRKDYIAELQNVENEIRMISHELNLNSFFEGNDFNTLLLNLINNQTDISQTKFKYVVDQSIDWKTIQNSYKINLYRIIQEAILNINKYANAANCEVKIQKAKSNFLKLTIIDDGKGFDIKTSKMGIGINNMKERTDSLKGKFKIKSEIDNGTEITVLFNLDTIAIDTLE